MKPLICTIGVVFVCAVSAQTPLSQRLNRARRQAGFCAVDCQMMIFVALIGTGWTEGEPGVNPDIGNA